MMTIKKINFIKIGINNNFYLVLIFKRKKDKNHFFLIKFFNNFKLSNKSSTILTLIMTTIKFYFINLDIFFNYIILVKIYF